MHLLAHPDAVRGPVRSFDVQASRNREGLLQLSYHLDADLAKLLLPPPVTSARADGLWRHTCFEAFIAAPASPAYCELNFAPSGEWAAYAFTGYRAGMTAPDLATAPQARWRRGGGQLELDVALRPGALLAALADGPLRLALSAVIEAQSGTITWWALRHPQGRPDFHHPDGFALELADPRSEPKKGTDRS